MSRIVEPSQNQQPQQETTPQRSKLVQRLLDASANLPTFLEDLLRNQAVLVAGTEAAAFLIERQGEQTGLRIISHIRPDDSDTGVREAAVRAFQNIVAPCVQQAKDGAIEVGSPDGGDVQFCLVTLLRGEGQVVAVSAVVTRCRDMERAKQRLVSMQLVAGYFELYSLRRYNEQAKAMADRHQNVLQFSAAIGTAEGFESASMGLCNELANRTGATRVAIGWLKGRLIKIKALSHTEKFDKKQELVVQLQKVMEECLDQEEPVKYDPEGNCSQNVTRCAAEHSGKQGGNIVLSTPLRYRDEIVGVLTVELLRGQVLDEQTEGTVSVAAELIGAQLFDRYENDRWIWVKIGHSIQRLLKMGREPKHMGIKMLIVASALLIGFVTFFPMTYRVRAPFQLVAKDKRFVCAPSKGPVKEVFFKPGQSIAKDTVLAVMDTTDLELRRADLHAQVEIEKRSAAAYQAADDASKMADYNIALAKIESAQAQLGAVNWEIEQAHIKAPFNCVILKGDLFDRRGAPVEQGDVLFEVAQSDPEHPDRIAVEVESLISERDIQEVKSIFDKGQAAGAQKRPYDGELATTSDPREGFKYSITRIVPVGQAKDGENVFSVYGDIQNPPEWMHPGLAGESRVNIEKRTILWIWTHRLVDWMKLKLWI